MDEKQSNKSGLCAADCLAWPHIIHIKSLFCLADVSVRGDMGGYLHESKGVSSGLLCQTTLL